MHNIWTDRHYKNVHACYNTYTVFGKAKSRKANIDYHTVQVKDSVTEASIKSSKNIHV